MIREFSALALNGFREARRNRVSVVVAAFASVLLLASQLVTEVTVYTMARVLTDFGLGTMSLTLALLAIFLSTGQLSREIERRTIFLVVSKPVTRAQFLCARFAGNMLTLGAMLLVMGAVFVLQVYLFGSTLSVPQSLAMLMLFFELMVLSGVGFLMSSFSSQMVSAVVTTGVYFAGHLSRDIYGQAERAASPVLGLLGKGAYYLLPNLERLNLRPQAAYGLATAPGDVLQSILYACAYTGLMLGLAVVLFQRRDFK